MILIYNLVLFILLIPALPFILLKSTVDKRLRYKLSKRFFPEPIKLNDYILIHTSSFGETKSILKYAEELKKITEKEIVHSVFTDTAFEAVKDKNTILAPVDLYPLYTILFKKSKPAVAVFFETEIWPSYIAYLKRHSIPLILINARMSENSLKMYKKFSLIFKKTIKSFDLIAAKSKEDAKRFKQFNSKVIMCGNIKMYKEKRIFKGVKEEFNIETPKPIMVLASFHKEEAGLAISIIDTLKNKFFIILAPRHLEDIPIFESRLKANKINYTKRTDHKKAKDLLLLNTMGELEKAYSISNLTILGGSFHENLKGHNPIEPLIYNNIVIAGPFTDSFHEEIELLKKKRVIVQLKETKNYTEQIIKVVDIKAKEKKPLLEASHLIKGLKYILNCYIIHTEKITKKT